MLPDLDAEAPLWLWHHRRPRPLPHSGGPTVWPSTARGLLLLLKCRSVSESAGFGGEQSSRGRARRGHLMAIAEAIPDRPLRGRGRGRRRALPVPRAGLRRRHGADAAVPSAGPRRPQLATDGCAPRPSDSPSRSARSAAARPCRRRRACRLSRPRCQADESVVRLLADADCPQGARRVLLGPSGRSARMLGAPLGAAVVAPG
jgi:hypothetical protein